MSVKLPIVYYIPSWLILNRNSGNIEAYLIIVNATSNVAFGNVYHIRERHICSVEDVRLNRATGVKSHADEIVPMIG